MLAFPFVQQSNHCAREELLYELEELLYELKTGSGRPPAAPGRQRT
jgi:hypothetical protein